MTFNIKSLLIVLCGIVAGNSMQFNNNNFNNQNNNMFNNNFNNQFNRFNNNIGMNNINDFYNNPNRIKKYLQKRIKNINNNGMQLNYENIDRTDLDLFEYNIKNFPSAKANIKVCLNSLIPNDISINEICNIIKYICNQNDNEQIFPSDNINEFIQMNKNEQSIPLDNVSEFIQMIVSYYIDCIQRGIDINKIQQTLSVPNDMNLLNNYYTNYYMSYYYTDIYWNYYKKKLLNAMNNHYFINNNLYNITSDEIKQAIAKIKEIDLANVIKKLIVGINCRNIII